MILRVKLEAFLMLEIMISRDRVINISRSTGAQVAESGSCG
jgi:hypothetical protein